MLARGRLLLLLIAISAGGCGEKPGPQPSDPHPPADDVEHLLADLYGEFVEALERGRPAAVCRHLDRRLAEAYRCGGPDVRIPRKLRGIEVPLASVFAARDPSVPREIQISSEARGEGGSLIAFFRRGAGEWRITRVMIGSYG